MEKEILCALIAAGTSIITVLMIKPCIDKHLLKYKLKQDYIFDQSKKVKEHIALHKGRLLQSAEHLNSRMRNFAKKHTEGWLDVRGKYCEDRHYIDTTVYRFLSFFAQIQLIESKLIFVDTTISQKRDIRMLKYFRLFHEVMCDVDLFKGFSYNKNIAKDHFFTTPFYNLSNCLINDDHVINLDEFSAQKKTLLSKIETVS